MKAILLAALWVWTISASGWVIWTSWWKLLGGQDNASGDYARRWLWVLFRWPSVRLKWMYDIRKPITRSLWRGKYVRQFGENVLLSDGGAVYHEFFVEWEPAPWCVGWKMWPVIEVRNITL